MNVGAHLCYQTRRMTPRDIKAVHQLDCEVFKDPWPESAYIEEVYFNPNAFYFVLESNTGTDSQGRLLPWNWLQRPKIVGFVGGRLKLPRGHISTLAVSPDLRGLHLGEYLLVTELEALLEASAQFVTLEVRVSNVAAQRLYQKYEFTIQDRQRRYYANGEDAYLMRAETHTTAYRRWVGRQRRALEHSFAWLETITDKEVV